MVGKVRTIGALSAALLAGSLLSAPVAHAQGSSFGTPDSVQSADDASVQSDRQAIQPKHKVMVHHRRFAQAMRKHEFAAREKMRGRFLDTREDRVTAELNERQIEGRATVVPASYGRPADADRNQTKGKQKKAALTGANGGLTMGSGTGITNAVVHN